jgi:DNA (cytosine-5)-methyltransferase 1
MGVRLNELALFAGAGGGILGGHILGWRTVCAVEYDCYAAAVLCQRQNDGVLPPFPVWDDVRTFDGRSWRGVVDVVSGGFPCQDISVAGAGTGIDGERSGLWSEMARIVGVVRPRFVYVENSPALTVRGLGRVLGDLATLGYDAEWGVLGAVHSGAPHRRERIWIVGHTLCNGWGTRGHDNGEYDRAELATNGEHSGEVAYAKCIGLQRGEPTNGKASSMRRRFAVKGCKGDVADTESYGGRSGLCQGGQECHRDQPCDCGPHASDADSQQHEGCAYEGCRQRQGEAAPVVSADPISDGLENRIPAGHRGGPSAEREAVETSQGPFGTWWATEPNVGRVAHGVAARVDRLKAIGNGQVPAVAALAFRVLARK